MYESASDSDNAALTQRVVELLSGGRAGLVTDVDGTISPIVARPEEAIVLPGARDALAGLRDLLAVVAVVTGRSVEDGRRLVNVDGLTYIGNHGLEAWTDDHAQLVAEARPWVPRLAAVLDQVAERLPPDLKPGVLFENKGVTASLHYRLTPDPDSARRELLDILARCAVTSGLRVEEGRRVINLLPPLTVTKGSAVTWLVRDNDLDRMVYLGDDITDAHAFRALDLLRQSKAVQTLAIGVVGPETPSSVRQLADASVPTVQAVADLLCGVREGLRSSATMNSGRAPSVRRD